MATSLTRKGLVAASDKVIVAAQPALELVKLFTTDFTPDTAAEGTTISVKVFAADAKDFAKGTQNYVKATNTIKHADVVLNKDKISAYTLDDLDVLDEEFASCWNQFAPTAGRAVGNAFVKDVTGLLTYGKADSAKTLGGFALADFVALRAMAEQGGFDPADCTVILEPVAYAALVSVLPASIVGEGGVINGALVGSRFGFKSIIEGPTISKASGAEAQKGVGFIVPTGAIAIANRWKAPIKGAVGNTIEAGYSVDEETGIVIGTRVVVDAGDGVAAWSAEALYGCALAKQGDNKAPGFLQIVTA
jgi:hypothetical protein